MTADPRLPVNCTIAGQIGKRVYERSVARSCAVYAARSMAKREIMSLAVAMGCVGIRYK
jgi:hypothetical protein